MAKSRSSSNLINSKNIIILVAVIVIAGLAYKFAGNGSGAELYKDSPVVAHINGKPVYFLEADNIVKALIPPSKEGVQVSFADLDEKSKNMIIREVAAQRAMLEEAKKQGIKVEGEIKRKVYEFKNKLIREQLLSKFAKAEITEEALATKYDEIEKSVKGKAQIKVSHILLDSKEDAEKALKRLQKESFAKVAKDLSQDSSNKDKGGSLGFLLAGTMDADFEKAALDLQVGEVSAPVKTKFGWHIIKVEERKIAEVPPFEALKNRIAQDIYSEELKKYADSLLENVKIELAPVEEKKADTAAEPEKMPEEKDAEKNEVENKDNSEEQAK